MAEYMDVQCEGCGTYHAERQMNVVPLPGATLAFCNDCAVPSRAEELGVYQ